MERTASFIVQSKGVFEMFGLTHLVGTKFLDLYLWFLNTTDNTVTNTSSAYSVQAVDSSPLILPYI